MRFALAEPRHDAALRAMAASDAMPGWVRLRLTREPSFFDGVGVQGYENQVVALFDGEDVAGMGCRSIRRVFVDGDERDFGYLSGLRSKPHVRLGTLLGRGYRFLRELHQDGRVPGYLTTIVEDNHLAIEVLTSGRAGIPDYLPVGRYTTYAIPLRRGRCRQHAGVAVRSGSDVGAEALAGFLAEEGARKQFFPVVHAADFDRGHLRGLKVSDFRVMCRGDAIVGALAVWDQRRFRQTVVDGYGAWLRAARPALNAFLGAMEYRPLPAVGSALNVGYLALLCARDDDAAVCAALLDAVCVECAASDRHFLCVGLHERDPLDAVLRGVRSLRYRSRLYLVCWEDARAACLGLVAGQRVPHLEVATL